MALPRDRRRLGRGPFLLGLRRAEAKCGPGFPFTVPAIAAVETLRLDAPVTLLAGENGAGKSTVVEAAPRRWASPRRAASSSAPANSRERHRASQAGPRRRARAGPRRHEARNGYFLRAESFFNFAHAVDGEAPLGPDRALYGGRACTSNPTASPSSPWPPTGSAAEGLYVLDEPEAALSVTGQLALLAIVARAAADGAQFVIATHSPVLLAIPGARIFELDEGGATHATTTSSTRFA